MAYTLSLQTTFPRNNQTQFIPPTSVSFVWGPKELWSLRNWRLCNLQLLVGARKTIPFIYLVLCPHKLSANDSFCPFQALYSIFVRDCLIVAWGALLDSTAWIQSPWSTRSKEVAGRRTTTSSVIHVDLTIGVDDFYIGSKIVNANK